MKVPPWLRDAVLILAAITLVALAGQVLGWVAARLLRGWGG
jgi:hypothetical protein